MTTDTFFQWQNDALMRTIYPLREMKLRDFLVFYCEIDTWAIYKNKIIADNSPEVRAYQLAQQSQWNTAYHKFADLRVYFLRADVSADFTKRFPNPDQSVLDKINGIHKSFATYFDDYKNPGRERYFINARIADIEKFRKEIQKEMADKQRAVRNMGSTWRKAPEYEARIKTIQDVSLKMVAEETSRLYDFLAAFDKVAKQRTELDKWFKKLESDRISKERELQNNNYYVKKYPERTQYQQEAQKLGTELAQITAELNRVKVLPEKEQLLTFATGTKVTKNDIVRGEVEQYRESLMDKNQQQLLEEVVDRFLDKPERYPLWLQYMVIHFSGMRYKSAHGSWADPRDLLGSLRISSVEKHLKKVPDETIAATSLEKIVEYEDKLAKTSDPDKRRKLEHHLEGLRSENAYRRRSTLLNLSIDEENEAIDEQMTEDQILEELEAMQDELPDWMWKEIVSRTALRLKYVKDESWEDLTPDELEERQEAEWGTYREIMNEWKRKHLTGWREEHDRANRLVVTRAVCNEVAEHIQHLRGQSPPGGLTAKPEWYLRKEKDPKLAASSDVPFFVKPTSASDFKQGASILWLRWVDREPNAWRIARPLVLKTGEGLLPVGMVKSGSAKPVKAGINAKGSTDKSTTDWDYQDTGSNFQRNRAVWVAEQPTSKGGQAGVNKTKPKQIRQTQKEWLRWMHEATVAEVAETADGIVVLTFETALPYEDKRQSTIGVFKHSLGELKYYVTGKSFNGTFVGYVPEGELPLDDLKDMLDWNKILRRNVVTPAQMGEYWKKATQKKVEPLSFGTETIQSRSVEGILVEAAPEVLTQHHEEWITCYQVDPTKKLAQVYQPKVEIPRASSMRVAKKEALKVASYTYYRVTLCEAEPRAVDLYVRSIHVVEVPEKGNSRPVVARDKLNLRKISKANEAGKPIMDLSGVQVPGGTPMRISTAHKVTSTDRGDGVIDADGTVDYFLIVECPSKSSARGLVTQVDAVMPITEDEYKLKISQVPSEAEAPAAIRVKVSPRDASESVSLFTASAGKSKKGEPIIQKSKLDSLPKGVELTVSSKPTVAEEKEYALILECPLSVKYVGGFVLMKELTPIDDSVSGNGANAGMGAVSATTDKVKANTIR